MLKLKNGGILKGSLAFRSLVLIACHNYTTFVWVFSAEGYYGMSMGIKVTTQRFCPCTRRFRTSSAEKRGAPKCVANFSSVVHETTGGGGAQGAGAHPLDTRLM